jgi:Na+-translocating ferredoxin:NAD+ oxidoreductase RnfE subunit
MNATTFKYFSFLTIFIALMVSATIVIQGHDYFRTLLLTNKSVLDIMFLNYHATSTYVIGNWPIVIQIVLLVYSLLWFIATLVYLIKDENRI